MYDIFEKIIKERGLRPADVSRGTGLSSTFFTEWKKGKSKNPNPLNLQKIADFLDVSVDYLMTGEEQENYYVNDDARELAEFLHKNPEYKVLFNASRNVKREDIEFVKTMLDKFRQD